MLTRAEVRTVRGTLLSLPLEDVENGYAVNEIDGLDPVKATMVSSSFATVDGAQYHSSKRETRNIKFNIDYKPDYVNSSVKDLRDRLYSFFMPKSLVFLRFYDDSGLYVDIDGRVESFEGPIFTKDPDANISILCFDPDFVNPIGVSLSGSTVSDLTTFDINYLGTVETGIEFILAINRAGVSAFTIYNTGPDGILQQLSFASAVGDTALSAGDTVRISTISGAKGGWRTHLGVLSSVLYGISPQSKWIELLQGINKIRVFSSGAPIPYTLNYSTRYGGL